MDEGVPQLSIKGHPFSSHLVSNASILERLWVGTKALKVHVLSEIVIPLQLLLDLVDPTCVILGIVAKSPCRVLLALFVTFLVLNFTGLTLKGSTFTTIVVISGLLCFLSYYGFHL